MIDFASRTTRAVFALTFVAMAGFLGFPVFWMVSTAFKPGSEIFVPTRNAPALSTQQTISTATTLLSSIMGLIVTVLAFRSLK